MTEPSDESEPASQAQVTPINATESEVTSHTSSKPASSKPASKKSNSKKKYKRPKPKANPEPLTNEPEVKPKPEPSPKTFSNRPNVQLPDKSAHDRRTLVRRRLAEGVNFTKIKGKYAIVMNAPIPDEEIDQLLKGMAEIQSLLFCRLLLSHASMLPSALKANSVTEFLDDTEITPTELRNLALRLDKPSLQEIRDACADLDRIDEEDDGEYKGSEEEFDVDETAEKMEMLSWSDKDTPSKGLPKSWAPEREKQETEARKQERIFIEKSKNSSQHSEGGGKGTGVIDFGGVDDDERKYKGIRIKICGKFIHNYPSQKAVSRGGWLYFCLIAKDSDLHDAIKLCRNWNEFFHINILANYEYFPAAQWWLWKGDTKRQQLLSLVGLSTRQNSHGFALTYPL